MDGSKRSMKSILQVLAMGGRAEVLTGDVHAHLLHFN